MARGKRLTPNKRSHLVSLPRCRASSFVLCFDPYRGTSPTHVRLYNTNRRSLSEPFCPRRARPRPWSCTASAPRRACSAMNNRTSFLIYSSRLLGTRRPLPGGYRGTSLMSETVAVPPRAAPLPAAANASGTDTSPALKLSITAVLGSLPCSPAPQGAPEPRGYIELDLYVWCRKLPYCAPMGTGKALGPGKEP